MRVQLAAVHCEKGAIKENLPAIARLDWRTAILTADIPL
jgi:hypothetical protein